MLNISNFYLTNQNILKNISSQGIKSGVQLLKNQEDFIPSLDEHSDHGVCVNVINKPISPFSKANWLSLSIRELLYNPARGIYPIGVERKTTKEELNQFYNEKDELFLNQIARRVHHTVLFVIDLTKLGSRGKEILIEKPYLRSEEAIEEGIPPEAITHVFIPKGLEKIALGVFNNCEVSFIDSEEVELSLPLPYNVKISDELGKNENYIAFVNKRLGVVSAPNYQKAITELAEKHFGDIKNFNDKRKPLAFHLTRLHC